MGKRSALLLGCLAVVWIAARTLIRADEGIEYARVVDTVRDGDVIFQQSRSKQSRAIAEATRSRYTHVGLVFGARSTTPYVLEAVQPVKRTPLRQWIQRGADAHFVLMRVSGATIDTTALQREAETFLGRDYDLTFDWSDARIYCSELVWKAYERALRIRLGEPEP